MYKVTIKGYFDFGTPKSFEKACRNFQQRQEVYYKRDILLKEEEIFFPDRQMMQVPRLIGPSMDKTLRNTVHMLHMMADFAWSGVFQLWVMNDKNELVAAHYIEPRTDRGAVIDYLNGRELLKQANRETEAIAFLDSAIEKFSRHARAYERRAKAWYRLRNYSASMADYNRSIDIQSDAPESYVGRAILHKEMGNYEGAIADLERALANAIPVQPVYWHARQLKGECHFLRDEFDKAVFDLKFFTKRAFSADDPNFLHRHTAFCIYGKALLETGALTDALNAFDYAIRLRDTDDNDPANAELLLYRGIARQKLGSSDFDQDLKAAANLGSAKAREIIEQHAYLYN